MSDRPELSVIVPAFNEARTIMGVLERQIGRASCRERV